MADEIKEVEPECRTLKDMIFYKMDRTLAVVGLVVLSGFALYLRTPETIAAGALGIGALATFLGVKGK